MTLKDAKKNFLIQVATELFLSRGIENTSITDIANEADVGEMTIYRYFGKKQYIVFEVVLALQNEVGKYFTEMDKVEKGSNKLRVFYISFLKIFNDNPNYYRFIREFDNLMMIDEKKELNQYEDGFAYFKNAYLAAYQLGNIDGSVNKIDNIDLFYYMSTHSLMELCKKLSSENLVLNQDNSIGKVDEINCLIDTFLSMLIHS